MLLSPMETPVFEAPCPVRFQDIDAAGIVFFARVFSYFHDAYVDWLASRGVVLADILARRAWGAPLVHAEADYRRPMRFGGTYRARLVAVEVGTTSLRVRHAIVDGDDRVCAEGLTVHAFIDLATGKPRPVPDELTVAGA